MWVRVARIGKPFGVRGQVTVQLFTDVPDERLAPGAPVSLADDGSEPVEIATTGRTGARWVLGLAGITDREGAEELRGRELFAPATADGAATDEWFDWQLVGLPCRTPGGEELGEVRAVEHPPGHDILVVATPTGQEIRVPFVAELVPDVTSDGVLITPPGGLFDEDV